MSFSFWLIFCIFIDIVNKILIIFSIYFVIQNREAEIVEMGPYLVEAARFWGSFDKADFAVFRVGPGAEGFEFGDRGVGAGDDGLPDIDPAGLVFPQPVEGLVDDPGFGRAAVDNRKVSFMNFPSLLHLAQKGSVFLSSGDQKEAGSFPIEAADER